MSNHNNILSIGASPVYQDSIIRKENYGYLPFTPTYGESEEIRIAIQGQDSFLLPCESYLFIQIATKTTGAHAANDTEINFVENITSFLFSDVRYELNSVEIDRLRNVGRSSTMKLKIAANRSYLFGYDSVCGTLQSSSPRNLEVAEHPERETLYDICVPLSVWFGFCEDYRKLIVNCKHELILNRARDSWDCTSGGGGTAQSASVSVSIKKIEWKMPHVTLSDPVKLQMLSYLSKNQKINIPFRSKDMIEYPVLPQTTSHLWQVKTVAHINRPRFLIFGLQTNRNAQRSRDATLFDPCSVISVRLHLNSQIYPYNMNDLDINDGRYSELYHMNEKIQPIYYNDPTISNPFKLSFAGMQTCALFAFDTSYADESLIDSSVDIKLEIKASENIPANTASYCLIIYDNEFQYSPFDGLVTRNI